MHNHKNCYHNSALSVCDIDIFAKDLDLTLPLKERVMKKIGKAINKLGRDVISTNVVLKVQKVSSQSKVTPHYNDDDDDYVEEQQLLQQVQQHDHSHIKLPMKESFISEVTINIKGGHTIHVSEGSDDMLASIDITSHKVAKALRRHHERVIDSRKKGTVVDDGNVVLDVLPSFDDEELLVDLDSRYKQRSKVT